MRSRCFLVAFGLLQRERGPWVVCLMALDWVGKGTARYGMHAPSGEPRNLVWGTSWSRDRTPLSTKAVAWVE